MKRTFILLSILSICCAVMVSCKNTKQSEPTPEEIQAQKVALADSVLAKIDAIAEKYINLSNNAYFFDNISLTEAEKMIKPDYLLEPGEYCNFITRNQKVNALAIYEVEYYIRMLYDIPTDEVAEVMTKLATETNLPSDSEILTSDKSASEMLREAYMDCKEKNEIAYFWRFQIAVIREMSYLLAKNPEFYLTKISEETWASYREYWDYAYQAITTLAPYDAEIALILNTFDPIANGVNYNEIREAYSTIPSSIKTLKADKYQAIAKRNALLK